MTLNSNRKRPRSRSNVALDATCLPQPIRRRIERDKPKFRVPLTLPLREHASNDGQFDCSKRIPTQRPTSLTQKPCPVRLSLTLPTSQRPCSLRLPLSREASQKLHFQSSTTATQNPNNSCPLRLRVSQHSANKPKSQSQPLQHTPQSSLQPPLPLTAQADPNLSDCDTLPPSPPRPSSCVSDDTPSPIMTRSHRASHITDPARKSEADYAQPAHINEDSDATQSTRTPEEAEYNPKPSTPSPRLADATRVCAANIPGDHDSSAERNAFICSQFNLRDAEDLRYLRLAYEQEQQRSSHVAAPEADPILAVEGGTPTCSPKKSQFGNRRVTPRKCTTPKPSELHCEVVPETQEEFTQSQLRSVSGSSKLLCTPRDSQRRLEKPESPQILVPETCAQDESDDDGTALAPCDVPETCEQSDGSDEEVPATLMEDEVPETQLDADDRVVEVPETCIQDAESDFELCESSREVVVPETCMQDGDSDEEVPETPRQEASLKTDNDTPSSGRKTIFEIPETYQDVPETPEPAPACISECSLETKRVNSGSRTSTGVAVFDDQQRDDGLTPYRKAPPIRQPIFDSAHSKRDSKQSFSTGFTSGRGVPIPKTPVPVEFSGFATAGSRKILAAPNPFEAPGGLPGFTTGNGRKLANDPSPSEKQGNTGSVDLDAIFAKARQLPTRRQSINRNTSERPKRRISFDTPKQHSMFTTAAGRQVDAPVLPPTSNVTSLFSTARGRSLETPATRSNSDELPALFTTARGKQLETPAVHSNMFDTNTPIARALQFNSASGMRVMNTSAFASRRISMVTPPCALGPTAGSAMQARRRFVDTSPLKPRARRSVGGISGTKPFKKPKRLSDLGPSPVVRKSPKAKTTQNLDTFFPKESLPSLSTCGRLVPRGIKEVTRNTLKLPRFEIDSPQHGSEYLFLKNRFGDVNILPKAMFEFLELQDVNTIGVDDCVRLMTHVFPAVEKKPATQVGSACWTRMSYGLAIWKLSRLEWEANSGNGTTTATKVFVTVANVLRELWRRVVREWHENRAPHLVQMLRRDMPPRSHVVLLVCGVTIGKDRVVLQVTDGWYICRMRACTRLGGRVIAGKLAVGDKMHVADCDLVRVSEQPFWFGDGDELGAHELAPSANSIKRVHQDAQSTSGLGVLRKPLYTRSSAGWRPDSGRCPGALVVVQRSFPEFFIESVDNGDGDCTTVIRRRDGEERAQADWRESMAAARDADSGSGTTPNGTGRERTVTCAIEVMVCGVTDNPMLVQNERLVRIYRPSAECLSLLRREGAVVFLSGLRPAPNKRGWTAALATRARTTGAVQRKYRFARTADDLEQRLVAEGGTFDGAYAVVHVTGSDGGTATRHVYLLDTCARRNAPLLLVLELSGDDAFRPPRMLRSGSVVVLRDALLRGINRGLGLVHGAVTIRTQLLGARAVRRDNDMNYLLDVLDKVEELVRGQVGYIEQVKNGVEAFACGEHRSVGLYLANLNTTV